MSRRIPRTARIWLTLTLGTTDEKASTNSYANLNHLTCSEFESVKLRTALSIMHPVTNEESRYLTLTLGKVNNVPRMGILAEITVKPYGYDGEI